MSITKNMPLNWYFSMKKKLRKIQIIFDIENWLWKSEIGIFRSLDLERMLIWQKNFFMKKSYFSLKEATIWWKILKCYLMAIYLIFNFNCSFQDLVRESTGSRILQNSGWNVLKCHNWDITAGFSYVRQKLPRGICSLLYDYQNSLEIVPLH